MDRKLLHTLLLIDLDNLEKIFAELSERGANLSLDNHPDGLELIQRVKTQLEELRTSERRICQCG